MFEKSSENPNVFYVNLFNWRLMWKYGKFDGAYKYNGDNRLARMNEKEYNMVRFGDKLAYICK